MTQHSTSSEQRSIVVRSTEYGYVPYARIPQNSAYCVLCPRGGIYCRVRRPFQSRFDAVLRIVQQANYVPTRRLKFVVNLRDLPRRRSLLVPLVIFGASACEGYQDIAAPDFVFGGWPEAGISDFTLSCEGLAAAGDAPSKTSLLGWYGNAGVHISRQRFVQLASSMPDRIEAVDVGNWHGRGDRLDQVGRNSSGNVMTMPEQVSRFRYLIDIEGAGYSGRLKMFLHSGRPVLVQDRPWREWFWPRLIPWKHYIPVRNDFSDLVEVLDRLDREPDRAKEIGLEGQRFARENLTVHGAAEHWRKLLTHLDRRESMPILG